MAESFSVGDRVEVIYHHEVGIWENCKPGWRGVIAGPLEVSPNIAHRENVWSSSHRVEFDNGIRTWVVPLCLRRIDDKRNDATLDAAEPLKVSNWSDCPWQPREVTHV